MQCSNMSYNKATTPPKSIVLNELFYSLADASDCCGECGDHCRHCNQKMITVTMIALVFVTGVKQVIIVITRSVETVLLVIVIMALVEMVIMINGHSDNCSDDGISNSTRGGGYSHILAIRVCAAGKGMVFKSFSLA